MSDRRDKAHDQAAYAFEGETSVHLIPNAQDRAFAYRAFNMGFDAGWDACASSSGDDPCTNAPNHEHKWDVLASGRRICAWCAAARPNE